MMVLDTDILIDFIRRVEPATTFVMRLHREGARLATTSINAAELLRGAQGSPEARAKAERLLAALEELPFDAVAAQRYGEIMAGLDRAGAPVARSDGLIAAAALAAGGSLVTRNVRDFRRVPGLQVVTPGK
ncbi:MAG TPA: type II toxin-antitoxin system VapC family toxin [Candidatus Thermoplasmatota archaeon]|nr:type II toxin-antitoxin system VapC family toxin [Candidatus Thermoplasmatota archaeon]